MKRKFIAGLILNGGFYFECVKPLLESNFPGLKYSAALLGYGSDVLGLDTAISMDHNWGPRLQIFISEDDVHFFTRINDLFSTKLPLVYKGFSTNFTAPGKDNTQKMEYKDKVPVNHLIEIQTVRLCMHYYLGTDKESGLSNIEWLKISEQGLIEFTGGKVFHDGLEKLNTIRKYYSSCPKDVLIVKMIGLWYGILNEEAFIGRCLEIKDDTGCRLILNRIINNIMKLCFYYENQYIPYSKWLGSCFKRLKTASETLPLIKRLLKSPDNRIERTFSKLYEKILRLHNSVFINNPVDIKIFDYYGRPYKVIKADRIIEKLKNEIRDKDLLDLDMEFVNIEQILNGYDLSHKQDIIKKFIN